MIQTAGQETQGQIIEERGEVEQPPPASNQPATGPGKSLEQVKAEMERDGLIVQ